MEKTGLARSTIYKRVAQNEFPKQISLGGNAVGWLKNDIDSWIESRMAESSNDNSKPRPDSLIVHAGIFTQQKPANDN